MRIFHTGKLLLAALAVACVGAEKDESRERAAHALTKVLGKAADPQIGFKNDSSHLFVQLLTVAFPTVSEPELTERSRKIAGLALRDYAKASQLDSITVMYREPVRKGMWWIRHTRSFPVDSLQNLPADLDGSLAPPPYIR